MPSVGRGATLVLDAKFTDATGALVSGDPVTIDIIDANGLEVVSNDSPTSNPSTGIYTYDYPVAVDAPLGTWQIVWSGVINGVPVTGVGTFTVTEAGSVVIPGAGPRITPCEPWASASDMGADCAALDAADQAHWIAVATDFLSAMTNHAFTGVCQDTIRPCAQVRSSEVYPVPGQKSDRIGSEWAPTTTARLWPGFCSCNRSARCGCSTWPEYEIENWPVVAIHQIRIDGAILDPSSYRLDDHRFLVRLDGEGWPCCQRVERDASELETWEIIYSHGTAPPPLGQAAAGALACQLALAATGGECSLPEGVRSIVRQGISIDVLDPQLFFDKGRTGIYLVDLFLTAHPRPPRVVAWSPDDYSRPRRMT